jgi:hypothetical protein
MADSCCWSGNSLFAITFLADLSVEKKLTYLFNKGESSELFEEDEVDNTGLRFGDIVTTKIIGISIVELEGSHA